MKLSIFTDEVCRRDPARALSLIARWGVSHAEVRSLVGGRFPNAADAELEEFQRGLWGEGLKVSGVSPGFFKCPVGDPQVRDTIDRDLPRACEWARRLGTEQLSCFAFARQGEGQVPAEVIDYLGEMARIAAQHGCRLILENEAACWGNTGLEAARLVRQIGAANLRLCWDPGNSARAGSTCPYPDEYRQFSDLVAHVHLKNFDPQTGRWALMEKGTVDWPAQLRALKEDSYQGFLVVETHLNISPDEFRVVGPDLDALEANTRRNLEFARACLRDA